MLNVTKVKFDPEPMTCSQCDQPFNERDGRYIRAYGSWSDQQLCQSCYGEMLAKTFAKGFEFDGDIYEPAWCATCKGDIERGQEVWQSTEIMEFGYQDMWCSSDCLEPKPDARVFIDGDMARKFRLEAGITGMTLTEWLKRDKYL